MSFDLARTLGLSLCHGAPIVFLFEMIEHTLDGVDDHDGLLLPVYHSRWLLARTFKRVAAP